MSLLRRWLSLQVLRPDAPFPSEQRAAEAGRNDMASMIKEWRREQRCKLVRSDPRSDASDTGCSSDDSGMGDAR